MARNLLSLSRLVTCCLFHMLAGMEAHLDASIGTLDATAITGPAFAPLPANLVDHPDPERAPPPPGYHVSFPQLTTFRLMLTTFGSPSLPRFVPPAYHVSFPVHHVSFPAYHVSFPQLTPARLKLTTFCSQARHRATRMERRGVESLRAVERLLLQEERQQQRARMARSRRRWSNSTLHPEPYTRNPKPRTLNPKTLKP